MSANSTIAMLIVTDEDTGLRGEVRFDIEGGMLSLQFYSRFIGISVSSCFSSLI